MCLDGSRCPKSSSLRPHRPLGSFHPPPEQLQIGSFKVSFFANTKNEMRNKSLSYLTRTTSMCSKCTIYQIPITFINVFLNKANANRSFWFLEFNSCLESKSSYSLFSLFWTGTECLSRVPTWRTRSHLYIWNSNSRRNYLSLNQKTQSLQGT